MQQRFSAIQLFCLFETSVRAERTLVRTERTDVTRSCADNGCRKIEAVFCNSLLNPVFTLLVIYRIKLVFILSSASGTATPAFFPASIHFNSHAMFFPRIRMI